MRHFTILGPALAFAAILTLATACGDDGGTTDPPDGPTTGTIAVTASTTGDDQDADGYSVMLDGSEKAAIGVNGSVDLNSVSSGTRSVSLSGVAENCAVGGAHPRSVTVTAGATAQVAFDVACSAAIGSIEVSVATSGDGTDPDGYSVLVDGVEVETLDVDGTVTVSSVSTGSRDVELSDLAPSCLVQGDNPQTVDVPFGASAVATFEVRCVTPLPGVIAFGSRRSGRVEVFTWNGATGTVTQVTDSPEEGDDAGGYLLSPDGSKVAYVADDGAWDLWVVNTDGTGHLRLTQNGEGYPSRHGSMSWSPDGSRIAFTSTAGVEVINADGTGRNALTDAGGEPVWAPDGSTILFLVWDFDTGERHIWRVSSDGSGQEQLTNSGFYSAIAYSPDGAKVLHTYSTEVGMPGWVAVMNADGSGQILLAEGGGPIWSPDGSKIAFTVDPGGPGSGCEGRILHVINSDGSGDVTIATPCNLWPRAWSPDGAWYAYFSYPDFEIHVVPVDGSSEPINIASHPADDWLGSWGP
jgi:Tol biopolymer transport system component